MKAFIIGIDTEREFNYYLQEDGRWSNNRLTAKKLTKDEIDKFLRNTWDDIRDLFWPLMY